MHSTSTDKLMLELCEILEDIKNTNILVIVEGKKDKAALQKFGIGSIVELSRKPLFSIAEEIFNSAKECVILTDLDKKGKELYGRLNSDLQKHGVRVDNKLREFLFRHTKIRQIEALGRYLADSKLQSNRQIFK